MSKKKQQFIAPRIEVGTRGVDHGALAELARKSPEVFVRKTQELIDRGELRLDKVHNVQGLFWSLMDVPVTVHVPVMGQVRAIQSSAFPILTGAMTVAELNAAYEEVPTIGQDLVTEFRDNHKVSILATPTSMDVQVDGVKENDDFPEIGASERKVEIRHKRNGRKLTMTAEVIEENNMPMFIEKVNQLGTIAAESVEEQTLRRVCDIDGSAASAAEPYVYRPEGVGTQLYNATANSPGTQAPLGTRVTNNALADESDLDAARTRLSKMLNDRGKPLAQSVSQMVLLVPDALVGVASKILNSEYVPGVENEVSNWGPRGMWRPRLMSSVKLDALSTTAWYLGAFRKQFRRKWKLDFEYVTLGMDTQKFLDRRIAFQARIAWDVEVGAQDYVWVVQNLSGTSAPTA